MAAVAPPIDETFSFINEGETAERDHPTEQTEQTQARTYGDQNVDLPEELQNALLGLVQEAQRQDLYQRRIEVLDARKSRFYEKGIQHVYEDVQSGIFVQAFPGASVPAPDGDGFLQCGDYVGDYNIFGRALQIIIAKLTENMIGIDFQPDSGDSTTDEQAAAAAEAYKILYDRRNDMKDLLTSIVRMMGLDGRTVTWTRTVADAQQYGTDEQGEPRKVQTTSVYGVLESKVPIMAKSINDWPYCILTEDPHILLMKQRYPAFADKIKDQGDQGIADTQFERLARIGALQGQTQSFQITDTYDHYTEERYIFFRPSMYLDKSLDSPYTDIGPDGSPVEHQAEDKDGNPRAWTLRDAILEAFPDGCFVTFVGVQYTSSQNKCMDDELAVDFPYAGDGMSRKSIMKDGRIIQDDFNDDMNNYHAVKVTGWPSTWVNAPYTELTAINDQIAAPYCFRGMKTQPPRDVGMDKMFWREPDPNIPVTFMEQTEWMMTYLLQFILAIPSAVQGAGMPDQKTKGGYQEAIAQAMGQLGVIFGAVKRLMSKVYRQAALAAVRDDQEQKTLVIPSPNGAVTLNMAHLGKGHFLAHPDDDSGYPESTMAKRATLSGIFDLALKDPVVAQALLQSPDNWDFIFRVFGVPEIVIPEARVRRKQLAEIEILVTQSPIGPSPQEVEQAAQAHAELTMTAKQTGGQPPVPFDAAMLPQHSSIQPDALDYHPWEFEACREKLSDWPWVQQQNEQWRQSQPQVPGQPPPTGDSPGIQNIRLHAMEHQKFIAQAAAQQMAVQAANQPQSAAHKPPAKPAAQPAAQPEGAAA